MTRARRRVVVLLPAALLALFMMSAAGGADVTPAPPALAAERVAELMEQARTAMANQQYDRAIRIYSRLIEEPDAEHRPVALEYLGVARERNGQIAHAKALYEQYLREYAAGEGAQRVGQRLAGLITARDQPSPELRRARPGADAARWERHAGISQYYRRDASSTGAAGTTLDRSSVDTDVDLSAKRRSENFDFGMRLAGGYEYDLLDAPDHDSRLYALYVDGATRGRALSARFGRQNSTSGGVHGRFDGLLAGYQLTPATRVNAVTGYPVASTSVTSVDSDRPLYGVNVDLRALDAWEFNVYAIEQQVGALTDRQAAGGEIRHFGPGRSIFGLIDYDTWFDEVNIALLSSNWQLPGSNNLNIVADHRKSPLLTTSNALIGQTASSIDELRLTTSDDAIRQLALDRTSTSDSVTVGLSRPLSGHLQFSGDVTVSSLSGTPASGGVDATADTGNDCYYSVQLVGNDLLHAGDVTILGLRYADTAYAGTTSLTLNTRYPVDHAWRVNPRLRVDHRDYTATDGDQWTAAPSLRVNYRWQKHYFVEAETGGEWSSRRLSATTDRTTSSYISLGYRADF